MLPVRLEWREMLAPRRDFLILILAEIVKVSSVYESFVAPLENRGFWKGLRETVTKIIIYFPIRAHCQ